MAMLQRFLFALSLLSLFFLTSANSSLQQEIKTESVSKRAASWLLNQRSSSLDWGRLKNTQALLALSRSDHVNILSPEFQCAVKELDISFLVDRLRDGELELYSDRLIPLATTLVSLCRSPTHYYDYDLLDGLLDHRRSSSNFTFALEMLTVCGGDGVIKRSHIRRLIWLMNPKLWTNPSNEIDTVSMIAMAAGCIANNYGHQNLLSLADQVIKVLLTKQEKNGSFASNTVSTALAVQAMQIKGLAVNSEDGIRSAIEWLISTQLEDGSFDSDFLSTTEVMLALSPIGGRAFIHLGNCKGNGAEDVNLSLNSGEEFIHFQSHIWVGQPTAQRQNFKLKVPRNSTVFQALHAAQAVGLLRFESQEYSIGHYIVSINNISERDSLTQQKWMIYILPNDFNEMKPEKKFLMKSAVSSYRLQEGERVLFWYRQQQH